MLAATAASPPPPDITLLHAGIDELDIPPTAAEDVTCLTLLEVIEHLDAPWEGAVSELLGRCKPHLLIVTTPNVEFNLNYMVHCKTERTTGKPCRKRHKRMDWVQLKEALDAEEICKGCHLFVKAQSKLPLPSIEAIADRKNRRNNDHRFEWTREQFRVWAEGLAVERGYAVRFDGVGGEKWDDIAWDDARRDPLYGPGPSSQMAIFTRCSEAAMTEASPVERLPQPKVAWSSAALDAVASSTGAMLTAAAHADEDEDWVYGPGWDGE